MKASKTNQAAEAKAVASPEERGAWILLFSHAAIFGGYFAVAVSMWMLGVVVMVAYVPLFIVAVMLLVAVIAVSHLADRLWLGPAGRDERDRLIEWRAEARSGWLLATGVCAGITALIVGWPSVWVAHVLLLFWVLSEMLKEGLRLVDYHRGLR